MIIENVVVRNEEGLHVRPASVIAKIAESCDCKVEILYRNNIINAKSVLNIVSAAIVKGTEIKIRCTGKTYEAERSAMDKMIQAVQKL